MPRYKLTKEQREEVIRYSKNRSLTQTAEMFGVTPGYVHQLKTDYRKVLKFRAEDWNPLKFEWRFYK